MPRAKTQGGPDVGETLDAQPATREPLAAAAAQLAIEHEVDDRDAHPETQSAGDLVGRVHAPARLDIQHDDAQFSSLPAMRARRSCTPTPRSSAAFGSDTAPSASAR